MSVGSASQEEPNPMKRRLTPHEESNTDHGAVPTFCAGPEGDVLGRPVGEDAAGLEGVFGGAIPEGAGSLGGGRGLRAGRGETAGLSQRILRARFRDAAGDAASAGGALARAKLSAAGPGAISTAGGGSDAADSGGVLARHLDAAGGAGGSDPDGRGRERADGLEAEPPSGPFGEGVSAGAFERRMGVPVLGWREPAGAAAGRSKARADAGGLRGAGGWDAPVVGLSAQSGREPDGLGRLFEQSVWARLERQEPAADRDRRLPGPGRRASDRLQVKPQRCWVHKMRNLLERVRKRDYEAVRADAQAIYRAESRREAERAFRRFRARWQNAYPTMVKQLERDLPELLTFFDFPRPLWRTLRTTNVIERCFVEVRRRTRPMVCFVNVASVDRIIYAIFNGYNEQHEWRNRTLRLFTQAA